MQNGEDADVELEEGKEDVSECKFRNAVHEKASKER